MNKKGAISLSINMLVVIVISLVIFGGGISLLYKLMAGAESAKAVLDQKTEAELRRLLETESKKVALPLHTAYLYPGEFHSFGLGILNIMDEETSFEITVDLSKAIDEKEIEFAPDVSNWLLYLEGPYTIQEHEYKFIPIGVSVPKGAKRGTYIFDVKVFYSSGEQHSNTKKFYVIVK